MNSSGLNRNGGNTTYKADTVNTHIARGEMKPSVDGAINRSVPQIHPAEIELIADTLKCAAFEGIEVNTSPLGLDFNNEGELTKRSTAKLSRWMSDLLRVMLNKELNVLVFRKVDGKVGLHIGQADVDTRRVGAHRQGVGAFEPPAIAAACRTLLNRDATAPPRKRGASGAAKGSRETDNGVAPPPTAVGEPYNKPAIKRIMKKLSGAGKAGIKIDTAAMNLTMDNDGELTESSRYSIDHIVADLACKMGVQSIIGRVYATDGGKIELRLSAGNIDIRGSNAFGRTIYCVLAYREASHSSCKGNLVRHMIRKAFDAAAKSRLPPHPINAP